MITTEEEVEECLVQWCIEDNVEGTIFCSLHLDYNRMGRIRRLSDNTFIVALDSIVLDLNAGAAE
jgi:hypothetical protein